MIRGRRVCAVVIVLLGLVLFAQPAAAYEMNMTATVPLSGYWKELLVQNSSFSLDTRTHRNIAELAVQVKGIDGISIPPQTVQALLLRGGTMVDNQVKTTDKEGKTGFTFVYKRGEEYRILLIGSPSDSPYVLKILSF